MNFNIMSEKGIENELRRKALSHRYIMAFSFYALISMLSIAISGYGAYITGYPLLVIFVLITEASKVFVPTDITIGRIAMVLSVIFSLTVGFFGLYTSFSIGNNQVSASTEEVIELKQRLKQVDSQLNLLKSSSPTSNSSSLGDDVRRTFIEVERQYNRTLSERYTYWTRSRKLIRRRVKKTGGWMMKHPKQCTGKSCAKVIALNKRYTSLKASIKSIDEQAKNKAASSLRWDNKLSKLLETQEAVTKQLQDARKISVKPEIPLWLVLFLIVLALIVIELSQASVKVIINQLQNEHRSLKTRRKVYNNNRAKALKRTKSAGKHPTSVAVTKNSISIKQAKEIAGILKTYPSRRRCYKILGNLGYGKTQTNYRLVKKYSKYR